MNHTSMEKEKRERAEKIFRALSGTDGELLLRSEEAAAADKDGRMQKASVSRAGKKISIWKSNGILAAAVCFAVLGVLAFGIERKEVGKEEAAEDIMLLNGAEAGGRAVNTEKAAAPEQEKMKMEDTSDSGTEAIAAGASGADTEELSEAEFSLPVQLSEAEARAGEPFGNYIPKRIPEGYGFSAAYLNCGPEEASESLFVSWTKGMDYIEIILCKKAPEELSFSDVSDPQAQEYPVFKSSEISEAVVDARMQTVEDEGDTQTPRGNFSVYYEKEGILLEFRGRGTAQEIWEMIVSAEPAE